MNVPIDSYPLGSQTEWDFDQSLFGLSLAGMQAAKKPSQGLDQAFRIARAGSGYLLRQLEEQHDLGPDNAYRQNYRNVMAEVRMFRARAAAVAKAS